MINKKSNTISKVNRNKAPVTSQSVSLVKAKGSIERGGGPGGYYWHIKVSNKRAGYVFINIIKDEFFDQHPSIQIHINQSERGKHIGRIAYKMACEQSGYNKVYAHMRKSNIASKKAAEEAGFIVVDDNRIPQLAMVWNSH